MSKEKQDKGRGTHTDDWNLFYPTDADSVDIAADFQHLAEDVDSQLTVLDDKIESLEAITIIGEWDGTNRPTCTNPGDAWISPDGILLVCDSSDGQTEVDLKGPAGENGSDGAPGENGSDGAPGENGSDGEPGKDGSNGLSAFELWVLENPGSDESDFWEAITGPAGQDGSNGAPGKDGSDGEPGKDGSNGLSAFELWVLENPGSDESDFWEAITGPAGQDGSHGEDGAAATIAVGDTSTGEPGTLAFVENIGTDSAAVFNFIIPRGDQGEKGDTGAAVTIKGTADWAVIDLLSDQEVGDLWILSDPTGAPDFDGGDAKQGDGVIWDDNRWTNLGPIQGPQGEKGDDGSDGANGIDGDDGSGWTGGSYDGSTGVVTFTSDDGLDFSTGDLRGAAGAPGANGADGSGVAVGGSAGQILSKIDDTDFNTEWVTLNDVSISDLEPGNPKDVLRTDESGVVGWAQPGFQVVGTIVDESDLVAPVLYAQDTNRLYYWNGSSYQVVGSLIE